MIRLAIIIGLTLTPTGLCAQGMPIDFDADVFEDQSAPPAPQPMRTADAAAQPRSVRYGERTVVTDRAPPAEPVRIAEARTGS